jgi:hypothetical protein
MLNTENTKKRGKHGEFGWCGAVISKNGRKKREAALD